jgi:hypothetical protein
MSLGPVAFLVPDGVEMLVHVTLPSHPARLAYVWKMRNGRQTDRKM